MVAFQLLALGGPGNFASIRCRSWRPSIFVTAVAKSHSLVVLHSGGFCSRFGTGRHRPLARRKCRSRKHEFALRRGKDHLHHGGRRHDACRLGAVCRDNRNGRSLGRTWRVGILARVVEHALQQNNGADAVKLRLALTCRARAAHCCRWAQE
jgi:hypothetical protein